jgi:hypothetical protein
MDRREFLRRAGVAVAALAVAPAAVLETEVPPRIYGDGIHDDAAALQWHLDHAGGLRLEGGTYRIGQTVVLRPQHQVDMRDCRFICDAGKPVFEINEGAQFRASANLWCSAA